MCLSSTAFPPPPEEDIFDFYQGFSFEADHSNLKHFLTDEIKFWIESLQLPPDSTMLDIGGGAGFFAKAFEHFQFGESTYVDLDSAACSFAKEELKLKDVRNIDLSMLSQQEDKKYDFIYCRHVVEHLTTPTAVIDSAIQLLSDGGTFILQFPNGLSLEYLAYPRRIAPYAKKLKDSNSFGWIKTIALLTSTRNAFAIDPIRHLWAITTDGVLRYLERYSREVTFRATTRSISDPVFSPYYRNSHFMDCIRATISRSTLARLRGGAHAVVTIHKRKESTLDPKHH